MPLFAVTLALAFDLKSAVKIALVALSVSPVPPILPKKALKAGGKEDYALGLLVAAATLAIIVISVALELFKRVFAVPVQTSPTSVLVLVLTTVLAPLALGIAIRAAAPAFAEMVAGPMSMVATVLLLVSALPVIITARHAIFSLVGDGTLVAFAAFTLVALIVGHLLGGPESENRLVLALSTASRHPGVAIAIAHANFPAQKLALAAVLLFLIVNAIVSAPYLAWPKRQRITDTGNERQARA